MSVFVVSVERVSGGEVVGVYLSEKLAKAAALEYVENHMEEITFKKKQVKKDSEDVRKVLYLQDTKESPACISMTSVPFDLPESKGKKAKKDPNAPKRHLSAFMIFAQENRNKIKDANPEATFGEVGKKVGEAWKKLSEKDKQVYTDKAYHDKERYTKELSSYTEAGATVAPTETAPVETVAEPVKKPRAKKGKE